MPMRGRPCDHPARAKTPLPGVREHGTHRLLAECIRPEGLIDCASTRMEGRTRKKPWPLGEILAAILISSQFAGIFEGRFSHETFWSWAPHDAIIEYRLRVEKGGRRLLPREIRQRYGLLAQGRRHEPAEDLIAVIRTREEREESPGTRVTAQISTNGGPFVKWQWESGD